MKMPLKAAAAALVSIGLLAGCSSTPATEVAGNTLTVWALTDDTGYLKSVTKDFEQANPGTTMRLVEYANEAYKTAIQVAVASDNPPDVFWNDPGEASLKFVRDNQVLDLSDTAQADGWRQKLAAGTVESVALDGKVWGVPWTQQSKFMFYNPAIFENNSVSVPKTLNDLLSTCKALKGKGVTPISFGNSERWTGLHYMTTINQKVVGEKQIAADYAETTPADQLYTDPAYAKALQVLVDMREAGCFNEGVNSVTPEIARATFYTGKAAMTFCGTWCLSVFDQNGMKGKYASFPFPAIEGGAGDQGVLISGPTVMQVSSKTKQPDLAKKFASFLVSSSEQRKLVDMSSKIPTNTAAAKGATMDPAFASVVEQLGAATGTTLWIDSATPATVSDAYQTVIQKVLGGGATPDQAMEQVRQAAVAGKK